MFEKLLHDVVSKDIDHQRIRIDHNLFKDALPVVAVCGGDLFLEKSRSLLVSSKLDHMSKYILKDSLAVED